MSSHSHSRRKFLTSAAVTAVAVSGFCRGGRITFAEPSAAEILQPIANPLVPVAKKLPGTPSGYADLATDVDNILDKLKIISAADKQLITGKNIDPEEKNRIILQSAENAYYIRQCLIWAGSRR